MRRDAHSVDHIYLDGQTYDLMFPEPAEVVPFLMEEIARHGDPVLELAVGTGRIALPLAQAGHDVTGLDASPAMLAEARRKADEEAIAIELVEADMRAFDLPRRFQVIYLLANALAHLHTHDDFDACMAAVRRHLAPGGRFVLSMFVPSLKILNQQPDERHEFASYVDPLTGEQVTITYGNRYQADAQINWVTTYLEESGEEERVTGVIGMRIYFPQELDALLRHIGFEVEQKYGSPDRAPFDEDSETQLYVLKKSGST